MNLSLEKTKLINYLEKQLGFFFPDEADVKTGLTQIMAAVIERLCHCFSHINKKYYIEQGQPVFNHLNADHYAMFLYFVANQAWREGIVPIAEKAFLLNKALHGVDAFYAITLPEIFLFVHPIGTILGNASYQDFLVVYQNVTIGADTAGIYPSFGKNTVLYSKCSVIGQCHVGDNVCIATHALLRNRDVLDNTVVIGLYPNNQCLQNTQNNRLNFFNT